MKKLIFVFLIFTSFGALAQQNNEEDIQYFIGLVSSDNWAKYKEAAQLLEWAGLSDERIYDRLEQELLTIYEAGNYSANDIDLISWMLKGLSFSGNQKYHDTVLKIANESNNKKIVKYANQSLSMFSKYEKWNPIIRSAETYNNDVSAEINRFANMLNSQEYELMRLAAKRIHYEHLYNDYLLETLSKKIDKNKEIRGRLEVDTLSWMMKALAGSRDEQYKEQIKSIARNAKVKKVRGSAKKYLKYYN